MVSTDEFANIYIYIFVILYAFVNHFFVIQNDDNRLKGVVSKRHVDSNDNNNYNNNIIPFVQSYSVGNLKVSDNNALGSKEESPLVPSHIIHSHSTSSDCSLQSLVSHTSKISIRKFSKSKSLPKGMKFTSINPMKPEKNYRVEKRKLDYKDSVETNCNGGIKKTRRQSCTLNSLHDVTRTTAIASLSSPSSSTSPNSSAIDPTNYSPAGISNIQEPRIKNNNNNNANANTTVIGMTNKSDSLAKRTTLVNDVNELKLSSTLSGQLGYIACDLGDYWNNLAPRRKSYSPSMQGKKNKKKGLPHTENKKPNNDHNSTMTSHDSCVNVTIRNHYINTKSANTTIDSTSMSEIIPMKSPFSNPYLDETRGEHKRYANIERSIDILDIDNKQNKTAECIPEIYTNHRYPIDHVRDMYGEIIRVFTSTELKATPEEYEVDSQKIQVDSNTNCNDYNNLIVFKANNLTRHLCQQWETSLLPSLEHICAMSQSTLLNSSCSLSSSPQGKHIHHSNIDELIMIPNLQMDIPNDLGKRKNKKLKSSSIDRLCNLAIGTKGMLTFNTEKILGSGGYGYVLKTSSFTIVLAEPNRYKRKYKSIAIKIGEEIGYLVWETLLHKRIQMRIDSDQGEHYYHHFCPPIALLIYQNSSVMCMELGSLGSYLSMINAVYEADNFRADEIEFLAMYFSIQALKAINVLHSACIIHTDIKTDNWVLHAATETDENIKLQLIDFGKAIDLEEICKNSKCVRVGMVGSTAVTDFECPEMKNKTPWSYQADYYAIVACIHTLLHGESLKVMSVTIEVAERKGYNCSPDEPIDSLHHKKHQEMESTVWIPTQPLKRYWNNNHVWSKFYFELINASKVCEKKDLSGLIHMFDTAINSKEGERLKIPTLKKLKQILLTKESRVSK